MPQQQRVIPFEFVDGTKSTATVTGNSKAARPVTQIED